MPRGDRTGPGGFGPMTGRSMGYCAGFAGPGYAKPGAGWGFGYGRGRGMGHGIRAGWGPGLRRGRGLGLGYGQGMPLPYGYSRGPWEYQGSPKEALEEEANFLKSQLDMIQGRLSEIEDARKDGNDEKSR